MARLREILSVLLLAVLAAGSAAAQSQTTQPQNGPPPQNGPNGPAGPTGSAPMTALVDQLMDLFPKVEGEVLEVRDTSLTLGAGAKEGARPGLEVEVYRQGREIRHPKTGDVLGRAEDSLGFTRIAQAGDSFSTAPAPAGSSIKTGDRFRVSAAKVTIVLVPLLGSVKDNLVETATQELVERLGATGRFKVTMGDSINVYLSQEGIKAEEFLQGKGVQQAIKRFKVDHLLAIYFKRVQNKPYMEIRLFSPPQTDPALATAFFVPS